MEEIDEIIDPKEIEVEKYTEDDYCDMLDEVYGDYMCCGYSMQPSYVFREMDYIAYRCGFNDYQEYVTMFECPVCGETHEEYNEAKWCCQVKPEELEEDE